MMFVSHGLIECMEYHVYRPGGKCAKKPTPMTLDDTVCYYNDIFSNMPGILGSDCEINSNEIDFLFSSVCICPTHRVSIIPQNWLIPPLRKKGQNFRLMLQWSNKIWCMMNASNRPVKHMHQNSTLYLFYVRFGWWKSLNELDACHHLHGNIYYSAKFRSVGVFDIFHGDKNMFKSWNIQSLNKFAH